MNPPTPRTSIKRQWLIRHSLANQVSIFLMTCHDFLGHPAKEICCLDMPSTWQPDLKRIAHWQQQLLCFWTVHFVPLLWYMIVWCTGMGTTDWNVCCAARQFSHRHGCCSRTVVPLKHQDLCFILGTGKSWYLHSPINKFIKVLFN